MTFPGGGITDLCIFWPKTLICFLDNFSENDGEDSIHLKKYYKNDISEQFQEISDLLLLIIVFTPHVPMFFGLNRHMFRDIELKFCILS